MINQQVVTKLQQAEQLSKSHPESFHVLKSGMDVIIISGLDRGGLERARRYKYRQIAVFEGGKRIE